MPTPNVLKRANEVLTEVVIKSFIFCNITPCSPLRPTDVPAEYVDSIIEIHPTSRRCILEDRSSLTGGKFEVLTAFSSQMGGHPCSTARCILGYWGILIYLCM
jgi:hypothetical protein